MSQVTLRNAPAIEWRAETLGLVARLNRTVLAIVERLERAAQYRRDRRILAQMSDGELADIGIGRSEIGRALRSSR